MIKRWNILPKISKTAKKSLKEYPDIIQQLLFNRKIKTAKAARNYLDPQFDSFHDFEGFHEIEKAADIILESISKGEKIIIHGDFDVDGICASSILWDFLFRKLGADALPYVPSRFDEGYGITEESLKNVKNLKGELIITVDCGIRDIELINKWTGKGLSFIVTDHHEIKKEGKKKVYPDKAKAIIHPGHTKGKYPFRDISGTAVVWKLICAIAKKAKLGFDVYEYLDLVALSTVCDVMPLIDENRIIVKEGLKRLRDTDRPGLRRLIYDAGINPEEIQNYHLGFIIGPRLNAAGRLDHAIDAIRLLTTKSRKKAGDISAKLNRLNRERQSIQETIYNEAVEQIEIRGFDQKIFFVWGEDWAEGVIGIVAGKISEQYNKPVLVATRKGEYYTGSARSIEAFNIIDAISSQSKLLKRYGGHSQAAGFTIKPEMMEQLRDNLLEIADKDLSDDDIVKEEIVDCEIKLEDVSSDLLDWLEKFSPFGYKNPKAKFIIKKLKVADMRLVGQNKNHLSLTFLNEYSGEYISAIGFGIGTEFKTLSRGNFIDVLFTPEWNEWNGEKKIQMRLRDIHLRK